ncbi:MAG: DUF554 domain-containing protein [Mycobacterium leprae]
MGTLVNAGSILMGGALGGRVIPQMPENVRDGTVKALGLGTVLLGLQMAWKMQNALPILISLALGTAAGEWIRIEERLEQATAQLEKRLGGGPTQLSRAFVQASLLFCIGAMAITGSLQDGLKGDPSILYAKAVLDGAFSLMFSSVMGPGVALSALPVLLYQGLLTLGASGVSHFLSPLVISEVSATGGIMVMAIGTNLAGATKIRVGNMLPALLFVTLFLMLRH